MEVICKAVIVLKIKNFIQKYYYILCIGDDVIDYKTVFPILTESAFDTDSLIANSDNSNNSNI